MKVKRKRAKRPQCTGPEFRAAACAIDWATVPAATVEAVVTRLGWR